MVNLVVFLTVFMCGLPVLGFHLIRSALLSPVSFRQWGNMTLILQRRQHPARIAIQLSNTGGDIYLVVWNAMLCSVFQRSSYLTNFDSTKPSPRTSNKLDTGVSIKNLVC